MAFDIRGAPPSTPTHAATKGYVDGVSVLVSGSANNPITDPSAARPSGLPKVFWQCAAQPANWSAGDEWIKTS